MNIHTLLVHIEITTTMATFKSIVFLSLVVCSYATQEREGYEVNGDADMDVSEGVKVNWYNRLKRNQRERKEMAREFVKDAQLLSDLLGFMQKRVNFFDKPMLKMFIKLEKQAIELMQTVEEIDE